MLVTLEVFYEFYLRGFNMEKMDLYKSDATRFLVDQGAQRPDPPFTACPGLGESAALDIVEARKGREFISIEGVCRRLPQGVQIPHRPAQIHGGRWTAFRTPASSPCSDRVPDSSKLPGMAAVPPPFLYSLPLDIGVLIW